MAFVCNTTKWTDPNPNPDFNPLDLCQRSPYYQVEGRNILAGLRDSIDPMIQAQMGLCGQAVNINAAKVKTVVGVIYFSITAINDLVLDTAVTKDKGTTIVSQGAELDGITIPAGTTIYGSFSEIKVVSGVARANPSPF